MSAVHAVHHAVASHSSPGSGTIYVSSPNFGKVVSHGFPRDSSTVEPKSSLLPSGGAGRGGVPSRETATRARTSFERRTESNRLRAPLIDLAILCHMTLMGKPHGAALRPAPLEAIPPGHYVRRMFLPLHALDKIRSWPP